MKYKLCSAVKKTVSLISIEPPYKHGNARFLTVSLNVCLIKNEL